jgi:hypothetical protein
MNKGFLELAQAQVPEDAKRFPDLLKVPATFFAD